MRFFFSTYCFGATHGQALIGVYKRGLRLALELCDRGHEVVFFCTGREAYEDALTREAESRMTFVDVPFVIATPDLIEENRRHFRAALRRAAPDCVIIGEAPLAGALLETTLTAVELGLPVVVIDNAYSGLQVGDFCAQVGPMVDAMVLMGPTGHHAASAPSHVCQLPPLGRCDREAALAFLRDEGWADDGRPPERLVVVLGYDAKVEAVGRALAPDLLDGDGPGGNRGDGVCLLFLARNPEGCRDRLGELASSDRVRVGPPPSDEALLGLVSLAGLAVVKYGFMQVAECLCLHTPAVVVYHEGPRWIELLPPSSKRFLHVVEGKRSDPAALRLGGVVDRCRDLLALDEGAMAEVHDGRLDGLERAVRFLETVPRIRRWQGSAGPAIVGIEPGSVQRALAHRYAGNGHAGNGPFAVHTLRVLRIRSTPDFDLYLLICQVEAGGQTRWERLWALSYVHSFAALRDRFGRPRSWRNGARPPRRRRYFSLRRRLGIEDDLGEYHLPRLNASDR